MEREKKHTEKNRRKTSETKSSVKKHMALLTLRFNLSKSVCVERTVRIVVFWFYGFSISECESDALDPHFLRCSHHCLHFDFMMRKYGTALVNDFKQFSLSFNCIFPNRTIILMRCYVDEKTATMASRFILMLYSNLQTIIEYE